LIKPGTTYRIVALLLVVIPLAVLAGCGGAKKKDTSSPADGFLTTEELYAQGREYLANAELRKARQTFERINMTEDARELEPMVRLSMADATFYAGDSLSLIDARPLYDDFVILYGDHERAPYAKLQAGVCLLQQVNHPSRDQSMTYESIDDLGGVIQRYPGSDYAKVAQIKIDNARNNLAEHDYLIGKFYMKKKAYLPAERRFRNVLLSYPAYPERDKLYFALGKTLVLADNMEEGRIYLDKLIEGWPDSAYARQATKLLRKGSVADIRKKEERRKRKEQARTDKRIKDAEERMKKARKKFAKKKKSEEPAEAEPESEPEKE
jgi:outer membrane protein assembly factor BamD